jgi:hypothetical protein
MHRYAAVFTFALVVLCGSAAQSQSPAPATAAPATPAPSPDASEARFVSAIRADLMARFPNPAAAEKAGYLRYTNEDSTGAISYANRQWTSNDARHPSQLWYSVSGKLLGADYSVPYSSTPPNLWGIEPIRWDRFGMHIHYGLAGKDGTITYGATSPKKYAAAGGDPQHPDAAGLVKAGIAQTADQVKFVFIFPQIWDMTVWVLPNPSGAFADMNPNVTPSSGAKMQM